MIFEITVVFVATSDSSPLSLGELELMLEATDLLMKRMFWPWAE